MKKNILILYLIFLVSTFCIDTQAITLSSVNEDLSRDILQNSKTNTYTFFNDDMVFYISCININNSLYIKTSDFCKVFDLTPQWDSSDKSIYLSNYESINLSNPEINIICYINNYDFIFNDNQITSKLMPILLKGDSYLPLRFCIESMGLNLTFKDNYLTIN